MKVLVTGASGGLGRYVVSALAAEGCEVLAPPRDVLDVGEPESVSRYFERRWPDAIVHLAALADAAACAADPPRAVRVNVTGTLNLVRAAPQRCRFLYVSTTNVFGGNLAGGPFAEEHAPWPDSVYAWTKLAGEQAALAVPDGRVIRAEILTRLRRAGGFVADLIGAARSGAAYTAYPERQARPVFAGTLAEHIARLVARGPGTTGRILHLASTDDIDYATLAQRILAGFGLDTSRLRVGGFSARAPRDTRLACTGWWRARTTVAEEIARLVAAEGDL